MLSVSAGASWRVGILLPSYPHDNAGPSDTEQGGGAPRLKTSTSWGKAKPAIMMV